MTEKNEVNGTTLPVVAEPREELMTLPPELTPEQIEYALKMMDARILLQRGLIQRQAKATYATDWITHDDKVAYLQGVGADRIAQVAGVDFSNHEPKTGPERINHPDTNYTYIWSADATWMGRTIRVVGTCNSKKKFFSKKHGRILPVSEVDEENIRKDCISDLYREGVVRLLALRAIPIAKLVEMGVERKNIRRVESTIAYGEAQKKGPKASSGPNKNKGNGAVRSKEWMAKKDEALVLAKDLNMMEELPRILKENYGVEHTVHLDQFQLEDLITKLPACAEAKKKGELFS